MPIPKPLPYNALIKRIQQLDIGTIFCLSETICVDLSEDEKVNGVFRDLEQLLPALSKFYLETDSFRKENNKLVWFGEREGSFKVAIGGDMVHLLANGMNQCHGWLVFLMLVQGLQVPMIIFYCLGQIVKKSIKL